MAVETQPRPTSEPTAVPGLTRTDRWWVDPLYFFLLFSAFGLWATFRAFENNYYLTAPYLSPLYSPTIKLGWHVLNPLGSGPHFWEISPALLILPFPLSFRLSCYYYRRSIYRAYLADPAGCAVPEPKILATSRFRKYMGERGFPLIIQNFHRFAFYAAAIFVLILWKDAFDTLFFPTENGTRLGIGVGTVIFFANVILLSLYTFSCHSWRHLIGGSVDCYSCSALNRTKYGLWTKVSFLNEKHGRWAMMSLVSVALTDVYVFLVATHTIADIHFTL